MSSSESVFQSSQKSCSSRGTSLTERRIQRFRDWRSPNSQIWNHAVDAWNQCLKNDTNHIASTNGNDSPNVADPLGGKLMNVLTSLTSLKNFTLLRSREQSSASYVKQSLKNLAEVTEKLFHAASSLQNQFESNGKRYTENESNSPSFLNEVDVRKESMENLLETIKSLQDEIQKLPELIEISKRKFQEEMTRFYEDHLEKALSSTIETCLAISKEKIDELTSFVIEDLSGL